MSGSFITKSAVLGVSGIIRLDSKTVFVLLYTRKLHIYPVSDLHCSKVTTITTTTTLLYFTFLTYLLTAVEFPHSGSSPDTSTVETNKNKYT
jgi:hypothetical protein